MWWRSPWLKQRFVWMTLAAFDLSAVFFSYNIVYLIQFGAAPGLSGSVIALGVLWVVSSYLAGRYSAQYKPASLGVVLLVVTASAAGLSWAGQIDDPRALPAFTLGTNLLTATFSLAAQWCAHRHQSKPENWFIIGSQEELEVIRNECSTEDNIKSLRIHLIDHRDAAKSLKSLHAGGTTGLAIGEQAYLSEDAISQLLYLRRQGSRVEGLVAWSEKRLQRVPPELFSSTWLAQAEGFELQPDRLGWRIKRLGDVLVATFLLLLSSPVIAVCAALIKLQDGGPILFHQIRTGIYGEHFRISKLRTMCIDAEPNGARWASHEDPRVTQFGYWMRRLRIDELPQLWSVIKGDMSLIGPRPERPVFEVELEAKIPHYRLRHWIRPGLSGWAQVCHPYGASVADSRNKLSYDLYYIRNFSVPLDFLILIKTIRLVTRAAGSQPKP